MKPGAEMITAQCDRQNEEKCKKLHQCMETKGLKQPTDEQKKKMKACYKA